MAIDYNPRDAVQVLPDGEYDGEITKVEERTSRAGNQMAVVTWAVTRPDRVYRVIDYIVFPACTFKYKKIAAALGEERAFENQTFNIHDHVGKFCKLTLRVEQQPGYDEKNVIDKYYPATFEPGNEPMPAAIADRTTDSEIPF